MLNTALAAGRQIARGLGSSERALDTSLVENARLLVSIVEGGLSTATAAETTQGAITHAAESIELLAQARARVVLCHQSLADLRDQHGLSPRGVGCSGTKPARGPDLAIAAAA